VPTVKEVQDVDAEGVQKPVPAVVLVFVEDGVLALVSVLPPAVYPVPEVFVTSPVVEYAVVDAFKVAELKNKANLNVSLVGDVKLVREVREG
jgi:hypothetical protein